MSKIAALENDRLSEQSRLDALKTAQERNKLGQFATPPALAREIACYAREKLNGHNGAIRFLDPAIGTGAFYAAALDAFPRKRIRHAAGVEIDRAFARTASEIWGATGLDVTTGDFTRRPIPGEPFNLILTNPPYVRHHHLEAEDKVRLQQIVRERLGIQISGLAGLYCYFLLLADAWLDRNGLAAWLIPSEFMDVNYGSAVKQYLTERVTLLHIHRFLPSDVQFDDALVSSAIVVFSKSPPPERHAAEFSLGGSLSAPARSQHVPLGDLRGHRKWSSFPRSLPEKGTGAEPGPIAHKKENGCEVPVPFSSSREPADRDDELTLDEVFTIKRGLATGDNSFFILPREKAEQLGIPDECLRPILPSPRFLTETIIKADADGYPEIERQLALIDCRYPEYEVQRRFPAFWKYLEAGMRDSVHAGYLASRRAPWYSQERRDPAPFLSTYMGRSRGAAGKPFRVIWNQSQAVAANVYLMLYPKPALQKALSADPSLYAKIFGALSAIEETTLTGEGRVYGGGLYKLEPAELGRVPCPGLAKILGRQHRRARQLEVFR